MSDDPRLISRLAARQTRKRLDAATSSLERADQTIALSDKLVAQAFEDLSVSRDKLQPPIFTG